jgi:hypothetical protein
MLFPRITPALAGAGSGTFLAPRAQAAQTIRLPVGCSLHPPPTRSAHRLRRWISPRRLNVGRLSIQGANRLCPRTFLAPRAHSFTADARKVFLAPGARCAELTVFAGGSPLAPAQRSPRNTLRASAVSGSHRWDSLSFLRKGMLRNVLEPPELVLPTRSRFRRANRQGRLQRNAATCCASAQAQSSRRKAP